MISLALLLAGSLVTGGPYEVDFIEDAILLYWWEHDRPPKSIAELTPLLKTYQARGIEISIPNWKLVTTVTKTSVKADAYLHRDGKTYHQLGETWPNVPRKLWDRPLDVFVNAAGESKLFAHWLNYCHEYAATVYGPYSGTTRKVRRPTLATVRREADQGYRNILPKMQMRAIPSKKGLTLILTPPGQGVTVTYYTANDDLSFCGFVKIRKIPKRR